MRGSYFSTVIAFLSISLLCAAPFSVANAQDKASFVPTGKLYLHQALIHAYLNNPSLEAARAELKYSDENYFQAQAGFKPTVEGNVSYQSNYSERNTGNVKSDPKKISLDVTQSLYSGGSTVASVDKAYDEIKAGRANLKAKEQDIFLSGVEAYMSYLRDKEIVQFNVNNEKVLQKHLEASQERFKLGDITKTSVSQAKARLAGAKADRIAAGGNLKKSRAVFEEIFGLSPLDLVKPELNIELPASEQDALEIAQKNHPLIAAAKYSEYAAKDTTRKLKGEYAPQVNLTGSISKTYDPAIIVSDDSSRSVGINATIPFYSGGSTVSKVRQSKHLENQLRMETYSIERNVRQGVTESWEALSSARAESRAREAQIEASKLALSGVKVETDFGSSTVLDLLDAEQEYLDAQVSYISAETDRVIAAYKLLATIGSLTAEGLKLDVMVYNPKENFHNIENLSFGQKTAIFRGDFANIK